MTGVAGHVGGDRDRGRHAGGPRPLLVRRHGGAAPPGCPATTPPPQSQARPGRSPAFFFSRPPPDEVCRPPMFSDGQRTSHPVLTLLGTPGAAVPSTRAARASAPEAEPGTGAACGARACHI